MLARILARVASILALSVLLFIASRALVRALPGDPIETLVAESGTSLSTAKLEAELHLDQPFWPAVASDMRRAAHGDLGTSIITRQPIAPMLSKRFARSLELSLLAALMTLVISVPLALAAAEPTTPLRQTADHACTLLGAVTAALPAPWIGPMLLIALGSFVPRPLESLPLLPALTLSLAFTGIWARLIRERVRETLVNGSAPGARARGIAEWKVLLKYGLAPASGALLAWFGTQVGALMAGAFVTEVIFDWPGIGSLLVDSVLKRDYPVVEATIFFSALVALLGNAAGDWAQEAVDPRL